LFAAFLIFLSAFFIRRSVLFLVHSASHLPINVKYMKENKKRETQREVKGNYQLNIVVVTP